MVQVTKSPVLFEDITHTYWLGEKQLSGITAMLERQLFFDKYDDVPFEVLENAAARGTAIHKDIATANYASQYQEVGNFRKLVLDNDLIDFEHEYLVSDNEHYASSIDVVFQELDGSISIADIKTTYSLDKNYVSWQLSAYAYLFELQNPGIKIGKLYAIWLRDDKAELVEVYRHSADEVKALLQSDMDGRIYREDNLPIPLSGEQIQLTNQLSAMAKLVAEFAEKEKELKVYLLQEMSKRGLKSIEIGGMKITYKEPYTTTKLDTKALKAEIPNIDDYTIHSAVKGSVTIKYN